MTAVERAQSRRGVHRPELDRRFEAFLFDWDGTAVPDRRAGASRVRELIEELCRQGAELVLVTGTNVETVDAQLAARSPGPGRLHLCVNRGSEVFRAERDGIVPVVRRSATPAEDEALTRAAELTARALAARGLHVEVIADRLNRRKLDLLPVPEWHDPPKARIAELVRAVEQRLAAGGTSIGGAVALAREAARSAGLSQARITSDAKHVEIGLTGKEDAAAWAFAELARRGIGPGLVLLAGDEFGPLGDAPGSDALMLVPGSERATAVSVGVEPGGTPARVLHVPGGSGAFAAILADQLARRRRREVPRREGDPAWTLTVDGVDPERERVTGSLLTLADGAIGTRGSPAWQHAAATPRVLAAGLYRGSGADQELAPLPRWNLFVDGLAPERSSRTLDLRAGLLHHELRLGEDAGEAIAFSSLATPGVAVARVALPRGARLGPRLVAPPELTVRDAGNTSRAAWMEIGFDEGGLAVGAVERSLAQSGRVADRVVAYVGDPLRAPGRREALGRARRAAASGFEALLAEHRARWGARWHAADVAVRGDDELTFATRFALFHLMASVPSSGDAALGARGLSGDAYRGHVFWDADVYVLPFLAATHPAAARALLEYRVRRLPAARERARREGRAGARFPWESAHDGRDVTPTQAVDRTGETVRIRTGALEEHVTAGVAWAASHYVEWSGDKTFARGPGRDLLVETARYWASRAELAPDGHAHIRGVTGPDEYHECVDDDAYTNVMARWNLRAAATAAGGAPAERTRWRTLADALVDGYDPATGLYEQFAGFSSLEPLVIAELAPRRPIAADLLLGRERVAGAQVVKQADVLMAHLLVPDEVVHGSLQANLAHYEPRTAHGSSLSPGVHAALLARARRLDEAVALLRLASRIDLDDLTGTTAGGLHMAAMGSVWLALAHGFAGLRARGGTLELDPALPPSWDGLDLRVTHRGATLSLELRHGAIRLEAARNVCVRVGKGRVRHVKGACRLVERSGRWHEVRP